MPKDNRYYINSEKDSYNRFVKMRKILIQACLKFKFLLLSCRCRKGQRKKRNPLRVALYYRICEQGYVKTKEPYITKENCLANAVAQFPLSRVQWLVVADNVSDETYQMIRKYIPESQIRRVSVGNGAGTFRMVYEEAMRQDDDTLVYFLEDDYLHRPQALDCLLDAARANKADYLTLYDHPDKYSDASPNPFVTDGSERTKVFCINGWHWKYTNSTTMTFAAFSDTLKRDRNVFWRWTETHHPYDFQIFLDLKYFDKKRLMSPIPSLSTHGDSDCIALGVDWEKIAENV